MLRAKCKKRETEHLDDNRSFRYAKSMTYVDCNPVVGDLSLKKWESAILLIVKGQLISKCPYEMIVTH